MSKYRKTRKQKIIADYRHQVYILENKDLLPKAISVTTSDKSSYAYVLHDASKTLILTLALVGLQIILFFLLKKHILSIPYLNY